MPISIRSCGYYQVVVNWCSMLCHTQWNHSPAWTKQLLCTASECVSVPSRATTRMRLRASLRCVFNTLMCFLKERGESNHSPRNFVDSYWLVEMCQQFWSQGVSEPWIGVRWNVWLYTCGLQTLTHSLLPIRVLNLLPVVNVSLWCPGSAHGNRSPGQQFW